MDASSYIPPSLSDDERANLKQQAHDVLVAAGVTVPDDSKWTITDVAEQRTKVMVGPAKDFHYDPVARELRGTFIDLKRQCVLSYANNPIVRTPAIPDVLSLSDLTQLCPNGERMSYYSRSEIMQIRMICAPDVEGNDKVYFLGNKFIDAGSMTWSRSPTFRSLLYTSYGVDNDEAFLQVFEGPKRNYQYDLVIHHGQLTNVGQIPTSVFLDRIVVPRVRIAGTRDTIVKWDAEMDELFDKPTPLSVEHVFDAYKYGYYYTRKSNKFEAPGELNTSDKVDPVIATIDALMPHERPADGIYVEIMSPDGAKFLGSVVFTTPGFEFRTSLLRTSKTDMGRICSDVEKLWYMRIENDPMLREESKRRESLNGWLSNTKMPLFGPRGTDRVRNDDSIAPWMHGGIAELNAAARAQMRHVVMTLFEEGKYNEVSSIYRQQCQYALRFAVSPSRRNIVANLAANIDKDMKHQANKLAQLPNASIFSKQNKNMTIESIYRPNRKERQDAVDVIQRIFQLLNGRKPITQVDVITAATGTVPVITNPHKYGTPADPEARAYIIEMIFKSMRPHTLFKVLCLCHEVI